MVQSTPLVDLVLLWHHHQPDYRSPQAGRALLPWVRLHATKDYLDMALRAGRHAGLRVTFNFVPSLIDQLEAAAAGLPDRLFELLAAPPSALTPEDRQELVSRCGVAPRWAFERWRAYRPLAERLAARTSAASDDELVALACHFLLAWLDPLFHGEPAAAAAIAALAKGNASREHRDALLALHADLLARVLPTYRDHAERGSFELAASAYDHPILPLIVDVGALHRARPDLPLPGEAFAAPDDARAQIERALARHAAVFGARPAGTWPPEGGVSPEALELLAGAGVRWAATDEGVLWASLPPGERRREQLYRPWRVATPSGDVALLFRDRELSDRIGFVYARWDPMDAVADFMQRLRRIGAEHRDAGAEGPALVAVILDGENCWENYAEDGATFLDGLYGALAQATDIRTRTPSDVLAGGTPSTTLAELHSGSWIDADFHIWCGQSEKNRAWDLLARARQALLERAPRREDAPAAWDALYAAEGSDWFWWLGDDHYTADKPLFDRLFREHLQAVHERAGLPVPGWLSVPIARGGPSAPGARVPVGFIHPVIDGRSTQFYEWTSGGWIGIGSGGGAMHHARASHARALWYGFDTTTLYLRLDLVTGDEADVPERLTLDVLLPHPRRIAAGLRRGPLELREAGEGAAGGPVAGASGVRGDVIELAVPFAALGAGAGDAIELVIHLEHGEERLESLPPDQVLRVNVPEADFESRMWTV